MLFGGLGTVCVDPAQKNMLTSGRAWEWTGASQDNVSQLRSTAAVAVMNHMFVSVLFCCAPTLFAERKHVNTRTTNRDA
jgi:hypothetical protein